MYIKPQGRRDSIGDIYLYKQKGLITLDTGCRFKKRALPSDCIHIFMILYIYIALVQGQTTHKGQIFYINRKASSLWSFGASLRSISSTSNFIHIIPRGQNFDANRNHLSLRSFAAGFKKSLKSGFIHFFFLFFFFMILYMYIALGQMLTTPWERNFDVNRNILSVRSFVAS